MEFDFLLPENNENKVSLKQNKYRLAKDLNDDTLMDDFLCIRPDPINLLESRPFPDVSVDIDENNIIESFTSPPDMSDPHLYLRPEQCNSNPIHQREIEHAEKCAKENEILVNNMDRQWQINPNLPYMPDVKNASPIIYASNIDVESRLFRMDSAASHLKKENYKTNINSYESAFHRETDPLLKTGKSNINSQFNNTSIGLIGDRDLFYINTKRKTLYD